MKNQRRKLEANFIRDKAPEFNIIVGQSKKLLREIAKAIKASKADSNILIFGEHGTGKELFARAIHMASDRRNKPFVKVNCAAIPDTLIESEFFGYEEGAFTGARKGGKIGLFQQANGGTLFLDEVGDLSLSAQAKLLTAIQDKEFIRIGGNKAISVDIRIIAATNKNLKELIGQDKFREDLYYRLNVVRIDLPPLTERDNDIEVLANYFLHFYCKRMGVNKSISSQVMERLKEHHWPGNVRELFNVIEYSIIMSEDVEIQLGDLPAYLIDFSEKETEKADWELDHEFDKIADKMKNKKWKEIKDELEYRFMKAMIKRFRNKSELIKSLGMSRSQFYSILKKIDEKEQ